MGDLIAEASHEAREGQLQNATSSPHLIEGAGSKLYQGLSLEFRHSAA
jgi:hypothetical protein